MKWAVLAVAILGVLAVLWFAGEQHRQNCEDAGKVSCSVMPWDNGRLASNSSSGPCLGWRCGEPEGWRGQDPGGWNGP